MAPGPMDPTFGRLSFPRVSHYYGDAVRGLMLAAAALMLIGAPLYAAESLLSFIPPIVIGIVIVVAFAALTNPFKLWVLTADAIIAALAGAIYGIWALVDYESGTLLAFVLRGAIALLFFFAFYFAMKTVRAMMLHQVGVEESEDAPAAPRARGTFVIEDEDEEEEIRAGSGEDRYSPTRSGTFVRGDLDEEREIRRRAQNEEDQDI